MYRILLLLYHATLVQSSFLGMIGYECLTDHTCSTPNAECRFQRCHCLSGYDPAYIDNEIQCIKLPLLGMPCEEVADLRHPDCADPRANCIDGICKCEDTYEEIDGKCIFQERQLGEPCSIDRQCVAPYTYCSENGVCDCNQKLENNNGQCVPVELQCLTGKRILLANDSVRCAIPETNGRQCPEDSYCTTYYEYAAHWSCGISRKVFGVCCPKPEPNVVLKSKCPVGEALSPWQPCPTDTHYKHTDPYVENINAACCPRPCPLNYDYIRGKCYKNHLHPGDHCEVDEQCSCGICQEQPDGVKRCECAKGFLEFYGKCHDTRCFHGDPAEDVETGDVIKCDANSASCPSGYLCILEFGLCCPKMPIYT